MKTDKGLTEKKIQFVELRAMGNSYSEISEKLRVSKQTLIEWSKTLEIELKNAYTLRRDELFQRWRIAKERRRENLERELERIQSALAERDLATVPTEKLFDLILKFNQNLKEEFQPIEFVGKKTLLPDDLDYILKTITETWEG